MSEGDWVNSVNKTFSEVGLLDVFLNETPFPQTPCETLFCREKDIFIQTALNTIHGQSKMQTFRLIKQKWQTEDYLSMVENISDRTALTKFRLSNHNLMIEKGRHQNMSLFDRTCPFCPGKIENEFHFMIKCPVYERLRQTLLNDVGTLCIAPLTRIFSFGFYCAIQ